MPNDIWKDPNVKAALKDGRSADDIAVLRCPKCDRWGYYNEGSHFYCRFCRKRWHVYGEGEEPPYEIGDRWMRVCDHTSLADTVTVTTDGYENETLANPRD